MKLYLESSTLVKLFKAEEGSEKASEIVSRTDTDRAWSAFSSSWSFLEVARALKKDGKPKDLVELDLREMRSHRIRYRPISSEILAEAERIVAEHDVYASDSIHAATYRSIEKKLKLDAFLTDDRHFNRLRNLVNPVTVRDFQL